MSKRNFKTALQGGMQAELAEAKNRVPTFRAGDRFANADAALGTEQNRSENEERKASGPKVMRATYTMPPDEYSGRFSRLKQKAHRVEVEVNKSELIRAGLWLLDHADDKLFLEAVQAVEKIKTGRPTLELVKREIQ